MPTHKHVTQTPMWNKHKFLSTDNMHDLDIPALTDKKFTLMPDLNADIKLTPETFILFVSAQTHHPNKEIAGLGYVEEGVLKWAAFNSVGTSGHVISKAEDTAIIIAECIKQTSHVPNAQIHTHPGMSAFWSAMDLNAQYETIDAFKEASNEQIDMYFIVYTTCSHCYGIAYALTRRIVSGKTSPTLYYNDGNLSILNFLFPTGKPENIDKPKPYTSWQTTCSNTKHLVVSSPATSPTHVAKPDENDTLEYKTIVSALNKNQIPSGKQPIYAALAAIICTPISSNTTLTPSQEIQKKIDTASHIDIWDDINTTWDEAIQYAVSIKKSHNTLWKTPKLNQIFRALDIYFAETTKNAKTFIEKHDIDKEFCDAVSPAIVADIFPERKPFLLNPTAINAANALINSSAPHKATWILEQIMLANGWFQYQVYEYLKEKPNIQKLIYEHLGSDYEVDVQYIIDAVEYTNNIQLLKNFLQTLTFSEITELAKHANYSKNIQKLFTKVNNCLYGYTLTEEQK